MARKFENVWESMLVSALGPTLKRPLPKGRYGPLVHPGSGHDNGTASRPPEGALLLTDLVLDDRQELFVLDAKDYAPGHYPETESITKQILYRLMHSALFDPKSPYPLDKTCNAFLFPGCIPTPDGVFRLRRHQFEHDATGWGDIAGLAVDFDRVSRAFLNGRADASLREAVIESVRASRQDP